jgi:hypothetical protein
MCNNRVVEALVPSACLLVRRLTQTPLHHALIARCRLATYSAGCRMQRAGSVRSPALEPGKLCIKANLQLSFAMANETAIVDAEDLKKRAGTLRRFL